MPAISLKLDCHLPGGSYKIRGVDVFAKQLPPHIKHVQVLSAGNLALAAALRLQQDNVHCEAVVPDGISQIKYEKLIAAGASITKLPFPEIWELVLNNQLRPSHEFLHPFNPHLLQGYGSIISELDDEGFTGNLVIPYGLGGLAVALAQAIEALQCDIKLYLCEIDTAAPFTRALAANQPVKGDKLQSFIEAMGTPEVIPDVFAYLKSRIAGVITVSEDDVKREIRSAYHDSNLKIEGAAGAALAAAKTLSTTTVALMTGENISDHIFREIVQRS